MLRMMSTNALSSIVRNLKQVSERVQGAAVKRADVKNLELVAPRLVAVSKTKSIDMIIEAYDAGQRHFGENYVTELHEKANDIELQDRCDEIKWHFIGHLQRNKVGKLLDVPNLFVIETVDSVKLAKSLNDAWARLKNLDLLSVMAQINTSGEENKNGCLPSEAVTLVKFMKEQCPCIKVIGLMTIGSFDHDLDKGPNPDFLSLIQVRETVCQALEIPITDLELSMGMSADYEHAIELGSTNVRVGSTIFGARSQVKHPGHATAVEGQSGGKAAEDSSNLEKDSNVQQMQNLSLS